MGPRATERLDSPGSPGHAFFHFGGRAQAGRRVGGRASGRTGRRAGGQDCGQAGGQAGGQAAGGQADRRADGCKDIPAGQQPQYH